MDRPFSDFYEESRNSTKPITNNDGTDNERYLSVDWLLAHRERLLSRHSFGIQPISGPSSPTESIYRIYYFFVAGVIDRRDFEMQYFFERTTWAVSEIPDPTDPDPQRYAILACLAYHLTIAFNQLSSSGISRGLSPSSLEPETSGHLEQGKSVVSKMHYEKQPAWVLKVPKLKKTLVLPNHLGKKPIKSKWDPRFLDMNIQAEYPSAMLTLKDAFMQQRGPGQ